MKYQEVLDYIEEKVKGLGSKPGLDSIKELLRRAGNPEQGLQAVHVAGSNGKGSTCAFLESALRANRYKIGWFSSPALVNFREMIRVGGVPISKNEAAKGLSLLIGLCREMEADGLPHPTEFELQTALAFWYFREKNCDYIILECGMGGAMDATNVIPDPILCIFTPISLEHCDYLGKTLEEITKVKSGIMKKGSRAVSGFQPVSVQKVLMEQAGNKEVELKFLEPEKIRTKIKTGVSMPRFQTFSYGDFRDVKVAMLGKYQIENAALALISLLELQDIGIKLKQDLIIKGISEALWPGRFELLGRKPFVVIDGAHNPGGVHKLMESVDFYFTNRRIIYIMSILKDKDVDAMLRESVSRAEAVVTVTSPNRARAIPALELAKQVREYKDNVSAVDSVEEALEMALLLAGEEGVVVCFGSLSYLGALRAAYEKRIRDGR